MFIRSLFSVRFITSFLILAVTTLAGPSARALCEAGQSKPSVSLSYAHDPQGHGAVTITYGFPNSDDRRLLSFEVNGIPTLVTGPFSTSGEKEVPFDITCFVTGSYMMTGHARACDGSGDQYNTASDPQPIDVDTKPEVSLSAGDPDVSGSVHLTVNYKFPNTYDPGSRLLNIELDGGYAQTMPGPLAFQGTVETDIDLSCKAGPHNITARAVACGGNDEGFIDFDTEAKNVNATPTLSVTPAGPDANGIDTFTVQYSFPGTNSEAQRTATYSVDGVFAGAGPTNENNTWTVSPGRVCWQTLRVEALACPFTDSANKVVREVHPTEKPQSSVSIFQVKDALNNDGNVVLKGKVTWDLPAAGGTIDVNATKWIGGDGAVHNGFAITQVSVTQKSGSEEFTFTPPGGAKQVSVLATAAGTCGTVKGEGALDCPTCTDAASNDPVQYSDGSLSLTENDPLPPIGGRTLARTYNSDEQVVGLFGRGWISMFERRLMVDGDVVIIVTDDNQVVMFRSVSGGYLQVWPKARRELGTLLYNSSTGTYYYRAAGATEVSAFQGSTGRLLSVRDDARAVNIVVGYDAAGIPSSLTDAVSEVQWDLTVDAVTRTVSQIAVTGYLGLAWEYAYDSAGNLLSVTAPGAETWRTYTYVGNRMTASYDALGHLIESHDFDSEGFATNSTGPSDEIDSIEYNLPGDVTGETLTRVTYNTGAVAEYHLRPEGGVLRPVRISNGCSTCGTLEATYVYDDRGRIVRYQGADGYITVTSYSGDLVVSEETALAPVGCNPATDVDQCRLESDALATAALEPTSATLTTTYEHGDGLWPDRITAMERPSVLHATGVRRDEYTYHPATGAVMSTSAQGWTEDPAVAAERLTQNTFYEVASATPAFTPGGSFQSAWLSLPQPSGLRKSVDGPRTDVQDVTSYVYYPIDATVPALLRGRLAATKNAVGHISRIEDYDLFGHAIRMVDANGVATEFTFDDMGRLLTSTVKAVSGCNTTLDPLCATDLTSTRQYSGAGPLSLEERPGGGVTAYTYDSRGRVATISRGPAENDYRERIEYTYDALTGKKSIEKTLAYESLSWVEKRRETYAYDSRAHLQTVTHSGGAAIHYAYDAAGKVASIRDENHTAPNTFYSYDPAGRLSKVRQTLAGATGGAIGTVYAYDLHGNLVSVTDPNGNVTTSEYDDFGQLLEQVSPVSGTTTYEYDEAGNLTVFTDANGAVTERTYDALSRAESAVSTKGSDSETVAWTYDDATAGSFGIGRPATMADPSGETVYAYERRGRLRRETRTIDGSTYLQTYGYDADGDRNSIGYPSGRLVTYGLDYAGRPVTATGTKSGQTTTYVTAASYLPFGPPTSLTLGNGTTETRTYDARYQPLTNTLKVGVTTLAQYTYTTDPAGNITAIADNVNPAYNRTFGYDDLNRLTSANTGNYLWGTGSFTYDAMGNRLTETLGARSRSFTYQGTTPRIATAAGLQAPMSYDSVGNELDSPAGQPDISSAATYSPRNFVASQLERKYDRCDENWDCVEPDPVEVWRFNTYDGRGVRVLSTQYVFSMTVAEPTTNVYFYTPELAMLNIIAPSTGRTADVIWFGFRPVADHEGSALRYTFTDHLGTPILQTTTNAALAWQVEYEPFGSAYARRAGVADDDQPLRFPGQQVSFTTGVGEENYNIFRWYRSGWGRYTQADPLGRDAFAPERERKRTARALYEYASDNPQRYIDPLGLKSCPGTCGVDCPGGQWVGVEVSASVGLLFGKSTSVGVYFCTSSTRRCNFQSTCTTIGIQAGGAITGMFGGYVGCKCAADIAATNSLSIGPIQLNAGPTTCVGVGGGFSYPQFPFESGSQLVVGSLCDTKIQGCMF